jgi:hypothetical protein
MCERESFEDQRGKHNTFVRGKGKKKKKKKKNKRSFQLHLFEVLEI